MFIRFSCIVAVSLKRRKSAYNGSVRSALHIDMKLNSLKRIADALLALLCGNLQNLRRIV